VGTDHRDSQGASVVGLWLRCYKQTSRGPESCILMSCYFLAAILPFSQHFTPYQPTGGSNYNHATCSSSEPALCVYNGEKRAF